MESVKKPTLEPIQTNVPSAQPHPTQQRQSSAQLVLPSDVRRSSMVAPSAPFSRSSNSSSSPTTVDSPTSILKPPRKRESYIESGKFAYTPQQQQSKRPSKLPLSPSPSSSLSGPIINSTFTRSSMLPPPRSASVPPLQQNRANTIAPISKPTTALDKPQEMPIQSQPNPANNPESSKSLGSRLKKAFTFNSKSSKKSSSSKVAVTNLKSSTMPATNEFGRGGDMDTRSLFSVRSTASTSSFATLRRVGGRLSKGTQSLFRHQRTDNDDAFSPNVISDFAGNANSPSTGSTAIPVVTHAVAEAEILSVSPAISSNTLKQTNTTGATVDDNISELNPPTDAANIDDSLFLSGLSSTTGIDTDLDGSDIDDSNSIQKETPVGIAELEVNDTEAIPSLTSSAESSTNDSEEIDEEEELAAADTVFPKKLDLLTVENIRSSLERTKSLERRRSRRSTHSGNEKERTQETVPNATEIHVVNTELQPAISVAGEPSKSILKSSSASTISLGDESTLDGKSFHSIESPNDTLDSKIGSSNLNIDFGETSLDLNFEFGQTPVNISLLQDTSKGEKVEASSSQYPDQEPLEGAKTRVRTNSDDSIHSEISTEQHRQFHYHPLYRHRMSEYHTRSSSYGSIGSDSQSVDQRGHYKSESAEIANTVSFSSRIVVFDTYGATDYDRHPELATCNRLTPLLAQQIKEELNTFKMEMDIHRDSRVYTHFF